MTLVSTATWIGGHASTSEPQVEQRRVDKPGSAEDGPRMLSMFSNGLLSDEACDLTGPATFKWNAGPIRSLISWLRSLRQ